MNRFGDAPVETAPSQQAQPNRFGDFPAQQTAFNPSSPSMEQAEEGYVQQKWEQYARAAMQSQGQKIRDYAKQTFNLDSNDPELGYKAEKDIQAGLGYVKSSISPEERQAVEEHWRKEYAANALNSALAQQQAAEAQQTAAAGQPEVGRVAGVLHALPRGAAKIVTEPVRGGSNLIQGGAEALLGAGAPPSLEGANVNAANDPYAQARLATQLALGKISGNIEKAYAPSTAAAQNPGGVQNLVESGTEMIPALFLLGPAFRAGGLQKALALTQVGGTGFQAGYQTIHDAAIRQGMSESEANDAALAGGAIDAVVNTYLMKFGALGQAAQKNPGIRAAMTVALKDAMTQGGVGAAQGLVTESTKYLTTGESGSIEAILQNAAVNALGGAGTGLITGGMGALRARPTPEVAAPTPEVPPTAVPVPSPETLQAVTTPRPPKALDNVTPKYRVQEGAESKGIPVQFESPLDRLLYIATQPRKGKLQKEAVAELKAKGYNDDTIDSYGSELRDRVEKVAKGNKGNTLTIPAIEKTAQAGERVGAPTESVPNRPLPVEALKQPEVSNVQAPQVPAQAGVAPVEGPGNATNVVRVPEGRPAGSPEGVSGGEVSKPVPSQPLRPVPNVAQAEADLANIRPQARIVSPSKYVRSASNAVEKVLGVKVVHINDEGGAAGFTNPAHPGVVFIDARYPVKGWASVLAHEWMHTVQDKDATAAKAFYDAIPEAQRARYLETYKAKLANLKGIDTAQYLTPENVEREVGAMGLQDAATRSAVRRVLFGKEAGMWDKIVEAGQGLWDKLTGKHKIVDKAINLLREKAIKPEEANVQVGKESVPSGKEGGVPASEAVAGKTPEAAPAEANKLGNVPAAPKAVPRRQRRATNEEQQGTLFAPKGSERVQQEADDYTKAAGIPYIRRPEYATVNVDRARRIAAAYDLATHSPNEPKVKASYDAFKKETLDQWNYLKSKGVTFEAWNREGQPYKNSEEMRADVTNNKHLYFYQGGDLPADHPLAESAPGTPYSYNDVFRAVHDYFGHTKEGVGFGPRGEENAWRSHSAMYSELARGAMTTETRGQNSWVNFGPHGEHNQANPAETKYAEQKATLLPPEFHKMDEETSFAPKGKKEEKELLANLTEAERASLTVPEAKRAVEVFRSIPSDEEFAAAAKSGVAKKGWYQKAGAALTDLFGPDSRTFTALLAADSPRQTVEKNLAESLKIWNAWNAAGRPTDPAAITPLLTGIMSTRQPNIIRALTGQGLSGYKVSSFKENLQGNLQAVTNDAWMAKFGELDPTVFADNGGYLGFSAKVRRVAKAIGMEPAQVQETIWSFFKTLSEKINKETTGHEALANLTHEQVAATPAFTDMLGDAHVRSALEQLGISEGNIRRAEGKAAEATGGEQPPTGFAAEGPKAVLNRIAQRAETAAKHPPSVEAKAQRTLFYPGETFIDEDVRPKIKQAGETLLNLWTGVKSLVAPQTRTPEARYSADVLRERGAELAQRSDRLTAAFKETRKFFDKLDAPITRDFIDKMEKGLPQTDPALQPAADALRRILDDRLAQVQALGTGKLTDFIKDYFPHLWKDPKAAAKVYGEALAKAPLEGRKSFLKKRTLRLFSDGLAKGLEPITENPVEAVMLRIREMDKYITIHQAFQEMGMEGVLRRIRARDPLPAGYAKINDNIATLYAKPSRRGAIQIRGYTVAPEPVANVINNYLSPGIRGNAKFGGAFRAYLGAGNVMNQVQLGMSGFHLLNTTLDSTASKLALAFKQAAKGQFVEAGKSTLSAASLIGPAIGNFRHGNLILKEWLKPGSTTPEIAEIVDAMKAAGGRIKMDDFYHTGMVEKMMEAWKRGNVVGAAVRAPFAAIEASAKPIMEYLVPRMKMGVFHDMAKFELSNLEPGATRPEVREAMRKAWDSVDNRMGELVYDNLFWNKAVKDLAMASTRSVGWNLGTLRELAGGVGDFATLLKRAATGGNVEFTHRMAYTAAMPIMAGLIGGMIHYALGNGVPKEFKDWFFPKTGEKDKEGHDVRLALPSYMKDVLAYSKNPVKTLTNKVHPMLATIADMLANEDYYGTKIRNEDDPFVKQLLDEAKYVGQQFTPFGVREVQKLREEGQGARSLLPLLGIVQARHDITHTDAELKALDILRERQPHGTRTQTEAEKAKHVRDLSNALKAKEPGAREEIRKAVAGGEFTEADIQNIRSRQKYSGVLERSIKSLDPGDAMKVWEVMSDAEKKRMGPQMFAKMRASKSLQREDRIAFVKRLQADWSRLKAGAVPPGSEE